VAETLLITGCKQLLTLRGATPRRGAALRELGIVKDGAVLVRDGRIAAVGTEAQVKRAAKKLPPKERKGIRELDADGGVVLPGFVDSHTHLIFPASRAEEYEQRIAGATYEEIAKTGGGILSTVGKLRKAPAAKLKQRAFDSLAHMAAHGTTTVEAKSGYGLDAASELKILRLHKELQSKSLSFRAPTVLVGARHAFPAAGVRRMNLLVGEKQIPRPPRRARDDKQVRGGGRKTGGRAIEIVSTFLGAHVVPPEFRDRADGYVELLCRKLIPQVAREGLAEYCDVFCDRGAFTVERSRRILIAARACGMGLRLHAEQLTRTGAAQLAVELHAASADHLEQINSDDIRALAGSDVTCTLLPGCCFHLGLQHYAPARALIEAGAIVALATDFNPGTSPTLNMQMVLSLACTQMRMTPAEAITAATINAAYSLGRADRIGSLEVGKYADIAVFAVEDYREIPYYFGVNHCTLTLRRGKTVWNHR
jgi:imidazolonepropionase